MKINNYKVGKWENESYFDEDRAKLKIDNVATPQRDYKFSFFSVIHQFLPREDVKSCEDGS